MNRVRRDKLAEAVNLIYQAMDILQAVAEEEEEAYDNLPESLQDSERGETLYNNADALNGYADDLMDITTEIEEM